MGSEFRVNTYTTGNQKRPSIAADGSGNFVVVWQSLGQDGSGYGIFGQRFTSAGAARGTEFRVNAYTTANQVFPSVTVSPSNSDFLVVWDSWGQDRSLTGVYGQRFGMSNCALPTVSSPTSQAVCLGASAFLTVTPSGVSPFTYQWRKNGINLVDGTNVRGSTAATLKISPFGAGDAGSYDCVVSDYCLPPASVTSAAATLTATSNTAPSPVTGLVVQKINGGANLKLTWNNGTNTLELRRVRGHVACRGLHHPERDGDERPHGRDPADAGRRPVLPRRRPQQLLRDRPAGLITSFCARDRRG